MSLFYTEHLITYEQLCILKNVYEEYEFLDDEDENEFYEEHPSLKEEPEPKEYFSEDREDAIKHIGHDNISEYECMECGCAFYGLAYSKYTRDKLYCPRCDNDDVLFIHLAKPKA